MASARRLRAHGYPHRRGHHVVLALAQTNRTDRASRDGRMSARTVSVELTALRNSPETGVSREVPPSEHPKSAEEGPLGSQWTACPARHALLRRATGAGQPSLATTNRLACPSIPWRISRPLPRGRPSPDRAPSLLQIPNDAKLPTSAQCHKYPLSLFLTNWVNGVFTPIWGHHDGICLYPFGLANHERMGVNRVFLRTDPAKDSNRWVWQD